MLSNIHRSLFVGQIFWARGFRWTHRPYHAESWKTSPWFGQVSSPVAFPDPLSLTKHGPGPLFRQRGFEAERCFSAPKSELSMVHSLQLTWPQGSLLTWKPIDHFHGYFRSYMLALEREKGHVWFDRRSWILPIPMGSMYIYVWSILDLHHSNCR